MNTPRQSTPFPVPRPVSRAAFSLIEVLVVVGLLSFIIFGLLLMFTQTQKAFKIGMTQTDVLEAGRVVTDMLARELEQVTPYGQPLVANFVARPGLWQNQLTVSVQDYPGTVQQRTNVVENLYFLTGDSVSGENNRWKAIGYFVSYDGGVGVLRRFETNVLGTVEFLRQSFDDFGGLTLAARNDPANEFVDDPGVQSLIEGVVHFQIRAFDTNGVLITGPPSPADMIVRRVRYRDSLIENLYSYLFIRHLVPAYVELELGILEKDTYERMRSIPNANARVNFLRENAGKVHLFRQRVTVRNVDSSVFSQ